MQCLHYPLLVAAPSGPILGEGVGWRRWAAIFVGFIGVIILEPGYAVFSPAAVIPLISAFMFALYGFTTRYVARGDSAATSFFWTDRWCCRHDDNRYRQLATHDTHRYGWMAICASGRIGALPTINVSKWQRRALCNLLLICNWSLPQE